MINGKVYSWEHIAISLPWGDAPVNVQSIDWSQNISVTPVYGRGTKPVGYTSSNWSANGNMSILTEDYHFSLQQGLNLLNLKPTETTISVSFTDPSDPDSVINVSLSQVKFTDISRSLSMEQALTVGVTFMVLGEIEEDGVKYLEEYEL